MFFFFQAEDGIRDLVRSRGLGDVYKRQPKAPCSARAMPRGCSTAKPSNACRWRCPASPPAHRNSPCLLYTSDAADERSSVDLGGRRIIKKKKQTQKKKRHIHLTKTSTTPVVDNSSHAIQQHQQHSYFKQLSNKAYATI